MSPLTLPPQSYLGWKIAVVSLHLLSIISTTGRLIHRFRARQAWWDDYIVTIPLVFDTVFFSLVWVRFPHKDLEAGGHVPPDSWRQQVLNSYWLTTLPCIIILWSTRSVLALSLARIFPQKHPARRCSFVLVGFMVLACIATIAITIATCKQNSVLLTPDETHSCIKTLGGYALKNVLLSVGDLISSFLLLVTSIWILRFVTVLENVRHMVVTVLLGSIFTILSAVAFLTINVNPSLSTGGATSLMISSLGNMESAVTLFVCNLAILSACFFPWLRRLLRSRRRRQRPSNIQRTQPYSLADELLSSGNSMRSNACSSCPTPLALTEISDNFSCQSRQHNDDSRSTGGRSMGFSSNQSIEYINRSSTSVLDRGLESDEKSCECHGSEQKSEGSDFV